MRHNDARASEAITYEVLKFRKIFKFEISCAVTCFSYIYLIINGKRSLIAKKEVKN